MRHLLAPLAATLILAACNTDTEVASATSAATSDDAQIAQQLAGRRITVNNMVINIGGDGSLRGNLPGGDAISGTWSIQNGQWCRTLVHPASSAGSECQDLVIGADTLTLMTPRGQQVWRFI